MTSKDSPGWSEGLRLEDKRPLDYSLLSAIHVLARSDKTQAGSSCYFTLLRGRRVATPGARRCRQLPSALRPRHYADSAAGSVEATGIAERATEHLRGTEGVLVHRLLAPVSVPVPVLTPGCNREGRPLISLLHEAKDNRQGHAFVVGRCFIFCLRPDSHLKKCQTGPASGNDNAFRGFPDGKRIKARSAGCNLPKSGDSLSGLVGSESKSERFERPPSV